MACPKAGTTVADRLRERSQPKDNGCIEWVGHTFNGYGMIRVGAKRMRAHRVVWELSHGQIPVDLCVCHRCDNPRCINVDHLFLGTRAENNRDKTDKGRQARGPGHGMRKERHPNAKLTQALVERLRADHNGGTRQRQLASVYGVSQSLVSQIINGKRWSE